MRASAMLPPQIFASTSSAGDVMKNYVAPIIRDMGVLASLVCVFFLINAGITYMTSSGNPANLERAKRIIKHSIVGLLLVLAAGLLTAVLTHAYTGPVANASTNLPTLTAIPPTPVSNGVIDVLLKTITGLLNNIVQSVAAPFLKALTYFTASTPLMASNSGVFNLWLTLVAIADALFVIVIGLIGFHVMGAETFGFDEIDIKHLLPRIGLVFLLANISIFAIDGIIELSNVMIRAVNVIGGGSSSVWATLTSVVKQSGKQDVAALLIMVAFLILSVILLVYYVGRIVALYIGAVLSPLIFLLWLVPGFRDFSESAAKAYLNTVFVLFVHVVVLQLAASLFAGLVLGGSSHTPDTLMAMILGLSTILALLKTQGVMMQFSYFSMGSKNARKIGGQFINGVSYISSRSRPVAAVTTSSNYRTHKTQTSLGGGGVNNSSSGAAYSQSSVIKSSPTKIPARATRQSSSTLKASNSQSSNNGKDKA